MKKLFIPAQIKTKLNQSKISKISKELPKKIAIAYSIQFKEVAEEIKKIISKNHQITKLIQVLGCSKPIFPKETQAVLLISSGNFHAVSLAVESGLSIYLLEQDKLRKVSKQDMLNLEKKQKASYLKFLHSDKIGILISTKPGQQNLKKALEFKKNLKKKSYLFLCDNINSNEFENFRINSWVNTACLRLDMNEGSIINLNKI